MRNAGIRCHWWRHRACCDLEHAKCVEKLGQERVRSADAKAQAVQGFNPATARKVVVGNFEEQMNFHNLEVAIAEVPVNTAAERVQETQHEYEANEAEYGSEG